MSVGVLYPAKSPGSENALPSDHTLSIMIPVPIPKLPPLPKIRAPSLRPTVNPASIPMPPSPRFENASLPERPPRMRLTRRDIVDAVNNTPITIEPTPPSPKKKRLDDGRAKPTVSLECEKDQRTRATLFGTRVKGEDMSLDTIVLGDRQSTQRGAPVSYGGTDKKNNKQHAVTRRRRAEHDMSVDDLRVIEISSDDDEPTSSQLTVVSERTTKSAAVRHKDAGMPSSQDTVAELPRQRSRAVIATATKKPPAGIVKSRKTRQLLKNTKPLSSSGATIVLDALSIDS